MDGVHFADAGLAIRKDCASGKDWQDQVRAHEAAQRTLDCCALLYEPL